MGKPFALPGIVGRAVTPGRGPGYDKMGELNLNHLKAFYSFQVGYRLCLWGT